MGVCGWVGGGVCVDVLVSGVCLRVIVYVRNT